MYVSESLAETAAPGGIGSSQQHVNDQTNALDNFSWGKAVLPCAAVSQGGFWVWGMGGCSSQPFSVTRAGVPRPPHPKPSPGDQPPPIRSPSGAVLSLLWKSHEMPGLKWVIHDLGQSWWHLLLRGLHSIFPCKSLFLVASLFVKCICLKLLFYLNLIQNNVTVSESEGTGKYSFCSPYTAGYI